MSEIKSMTGYGQQAFTAGEEGASFLVELRAINSRHRDVKIRLPWMDAKLETAVRQAISGRIARGRVDVTVRAERGGGGDGTALAGRFRGAAQALRDLCADAQLPGELRPADVLHFLALQQRSSDDDPPTGLAEGLLAALALAGDELVQRRTAEGRAMLAAVRELLAEAGEAVSEVEGLCGEQVARFATRVRERAEAILASLGENGAALEPGRLAAEVALLAEKSDVTEELVRLRAHLKHFDEILGGPGPHGRKLDFLLQEIHREVNTIGSKSYDDRINAAVVALKAAFEKIREVVQNVE